MQPHRTPTQFFNYQAAGNLLLGSVLASSLLLLVEFVLTAHDRRGAQRGQACAGKARHHDEVAGFGHIATRGLGRRGGSRRGGRGDVLVVTLLSIGIGLSRA